ncbi:hypothetical protein MY5147_007556 [Beauveria neobassiana]
MSFARSLNKAQGFLMPYRRPTFGRTLSNSSELSLTSNTSGRDEDVGGDAVPSAPGTPVLAPTENPFFAKQINIDMQVPREQPSASTASAWQSTHTPVSSYMPSGMHEHALPVGKYYPSNYERRTRQLQGQRTFVSESVTSYAKTDVQGTTYKGGDDARQRLQQYQRDMVAQASMALGGSSKPSMLPGNASALRSMPFGRDARFGRPSTPQRPISPQLQPMGSPGPVTPMDLEAQEEYITKGQVVATATLAPPATDFVPHSL